MAGKDELYKGDSDKKEGGFLNFLYNSNTKEVLGRSGISWFKITVFYIIFYACLTAFWTIMLIIFYQTLDAFKPTWTLDGSTIGSIPGLGFRPRPPEANIDSTLIYFKAGSGGTWNYWVEDLQKFTKDYEQQKTDGEHLITCDFTQDRPKDKACRFSLEKISSNCSYSNQFGYLYGQPCILIKLNRIYGWEPIPYPDNESMPADLPDFIKRTYDPNNVYISCNGENVADRENMGPVSYYPGVGIPKYYFPFTNVPGYLSPFVFVQFTRPERGVLINIECKAWASNIFHDRMERIGSVHFELMID